MSLEELLKNIPEDTLIENNENIIECFLQKESLSVFSIFQSVNSAREIKLDTFCLSKNNFYFSDEVFFPKPYLPINNDPFPKNSYIAALVGINKKDIKYISKKNSCFYFKTKEKKVPERFFSLNNPIFRINNIENKVPIDSPFFKEKKILKYPLSNYLRKATPTKTIERENCISGEIDKITNNSIILFEGLVLSLDHTDKKFDIINISKRYTKDPMWFLAVNECYEKSGLLSVGLHDGTIGWTNRDFKVSRDIFCPSRKFNLILVVKKNKVVILIEVTDENNSILIDYKELSTSNSLTESILFLGPSKERNESLKVEIERIKFYDCPEGIEGHLIPVIL